MSRWQCLLAAVVLLTTRAPDASAQATDSTSCAVEVSIDPTHPVVGEQVLYRARVLRRTDVQSVSWVNPLAFPNTRAEWLPGRAEDRSIERNGTTFLVREEHRALFPARPGRLELPTFALRCTLADGALIDVAVPSVTLDVAEPPRRGRPPDWHGAVGPLYVQVLTDRQQITLGESAQISVSIRGAGNLWVIQNPFEAPTIGRAEVFHRPAEIDTQAGKRLHVRRFFRFDVVPREAGTFEIPAVTLPYYDPANAEYHIASASPVTIQVDPRPSPAALSGSRALDQTLGVQRAEHGSRWPDLTEDPLNVVGVLVASTAVLLGLAVRKSRSTERRRCAPLDEALAAAAAAAERRDVGAEAAALTRAIEAALAEPGVNLNGHHDARVRDSLGVLERIRFSTEGERPDRAGVVALIAALQGR